MNVAERVMKGVTYYNSLKADNGYTLFSPIGTKDAWLIDMEGHIVNRWPTEHTPEEHSVLLPNGNLLRSYVIKGADESGPPAMASIGDELVELDWDSNVVWRAETPFLTHNFYPMENGHVLYCVTHPEGIMPDELAARWKGGLPGTEHHGKIFADGIHEIDWDKKIVWRWISYEHLDPEIDAFCPLEERNHFHSNAVWKCHDGSILFSCRSLNEVLRIEYPSGKVLARYGRGQIFHQHDCRELDNGNILVFDNGAHRPGNQPSYSRVVEIDPNTDKIVWEYKEDPPYNFYSSHCSSNERLPNGNTVICDAMHGRIFEVTYGGEVVWEYVSPFVGTKLHSLSMHMYIETFIIHRAYRYPRDYPGFKGKDLDPGRFPLENKLFGSDAFKKDFSPLIF